MRVRHMMTKRWWERELPRFEAFISPVVLNELADGDSQRAEERLKLVRGLAVLAITEAVEQTAAFYVEHLAMPTRDRRDAFHLALASVHNVEYLLTWNFAHLANASKRTHIDVLNQRLRLISPIICSPEELLLDD